MIIAKTGFIKKCAFEYQKNVIPIFDQQFEFPAVETELPDDIRQITKFNGVRWVHDYQEACVEKIERFIKGELNRIPTTTITNQIAVKPNLHPTSRKISNYKLNNLPANTNHKNTSSPNATVINPHLTSRLRTTPHPLTNVQTVQGPIDTNLNNNINSITNSSNFRSSSMEKHRKKIFSSSVSTVYSEK